MIVIDDYLANVPQPERAELERIRQIVRATVPEAQETISYKIPAFKYKGKNLVWFSAFKDHMSLFPTGIPSEVLPKLSGYKIAKGTIRFTVDNPLPEELVKELVLLRAKAIDGK